MLASDEILKRIDAAERLVGEKVFDEDQSSLGEVVQSLSDSGSTPSIFTASIVLRLATVLRELGKGLSDKDGAPVFKQAQEVLNKGFALYPDDIKLLNEQGKLYYDTKKYDKAFASFDKVIKKDQPADNADRVYALVNAGASLRNLRRFPEAHDMFKQAIAPGGSPSMRLLIERGWLRFYQELYDLAFDDFAEAQRRTGADASEENKQEAMVGQIASRQAVDSLNPAADRAGELMNGWRAKAVVPSKEEAVSILLKCGSIHTNLNLYRAALLNFDLILHVDFDNEEGLCAKIDALKWLRLFREAEEVYRDAQVKLPDSMELWKEIANVYYQEKRFQKAYNYYSGEALEDPANAAQKAAFSEALKIDEEANEWTIVALRKMRRLRDAENKVNQALVDIGDLPSFLCEKAFIYFTERKYREAIALFDRALKIDEYYAFAHQWRAASHRKLLEFDEAKKKIDEALLKLPADTRLWEERAWIAFDQNQLKEADEYFAKAIKFDPYLIQKQFSRVEVLTRLNRNDDAQEIFLSLKADFKDDIEVAEQLGWFYLRQGKVDHADKEFCFIETKDTENALGINGRGGYHLEQRDYRLAAKAFRRAIKKVDYEPQYHINLAWALVRQVKEPGEIPEAQLCRRKQLLENARDSCRDALKLDPFDAKGHVCLGVIAFKCGAFPDAEGYFRRSIELSQAEGGRVELGALYVQMGRYDDAEKELAEAIKLNNNDARAHIELGNLMLLQESNKEAVRECRNAAAVDPNNDEAHRALAIALMRAGQYEEAEKTLRRTLIQIQPTKRWRLHLVLSQVLIHLGDDKNKDPKKKDTDLYGEALNQVYEALRIHSSPSGDVLFHAGIAHYKLEDYKASRQSFDDCLKADRDRFEAERCGKLVQSMIDHQNKILRVNTWGTGLLGFICLAMLLFLWIAYSSGVKRTVPVVEAEVASTNTAGTSATTEATKAEARGKNALKAAEAAKVAEANFADPTKVKEAKQLEATNAADAAKTATGLDNAALTKLAEEKKTDATKAAEPAKVAEAAKVPAVASADEAVKAAARPPKPQQEVIVDKQMLTVYTPILLGLFVIALLLPNLSKLKLPGGIEAEISEVKTEISSGPRGDVGFGSSLPIISPGPR